MVPDRSGRELVDRIVPFVLDPGVNRLDQFGLVRTLCHGQLPGKFLRDAPALQLEAIRAGCRRLEPKVDANRFPAFTRLGFDLYRRIEIPTTPGILRERTCAQFVLRQIVAIPNAEEVSAEADLSVHPLHAGRLERDPAQCTLRAARSAPLQLVLLELPARSGVLGDHALDGGSSNTEIPLFADAAQFLIEIELACLEVDVTHSRIGTHE